MPSSPAQPGSPVGRGVARRVQFTAESSIGLVVVRFRVERKNSKGETLPTVPVEMRAPSFSGALAEGDWVEIPATWSPGQVLSPNRVNNLSTGVPLEGSLGIGTAWRAQASLIQKGWVRLLAVIGVVAVVAVAVLAFVLVQAASEDDVATTAAFELSTASAAPGETIAASGDGWSPGEAITFRYGPAAIATGTADRVGAFSNVQLTLPADASPLFAAVTATGSQSSVTREAALTVTP